MFQAVEPKYEDPSIPYVGIASGLAPFSYGLSKKILTILQTPVDVDKLAQDYQSGLRARFQNGK